MIDEAGQKRTFGRNVAIALVAVVGIGFFVTRKSPLAVSRAVAATVDHFAKGIVLGQELSANATRLPGAHWRRHVGLVAPGPAGFEMAVLLPSIDARSNVVAVGDARLEAIELTAASSANYTSTLSDLSIAFRGAPRQGCIRQSNGSYRQVFYWLGQDAGGGVAVITDMGTMTGTDTTRGVGAWSLYAWGGAFKGGETLNAAFERRACDGTGAPAIPQSVAKSAAELEAMTIAFRDSLRGDMIATEQSEVSERLNTDAPNACDTPAAAASTRIHQVLPFSIQLPADFVIKNQALWDSEFTRAGVIRYEWEAPDGSTVSVESGDSHNKHRGELGGVSSECDTQIGQWSVHLDVGNATVGLPRLTAGAAYLGGNKGNLLMVGIGTSQQRQKELLAAARTIQPNGNWR